MRRLPRAPGSTSLANATDACGVSGDYLTPDEVGALLKVSRKSVLRWARDDATMPVLHLGGTVRFPRERLLRWLRDREQGMARPRQASKQVHRAAQASDDVAPTLASAASCADLCADGGARGGAA